MLSRFLIENTNPFLERDPFEIFLAKSHHKYSKLNESILKRFFSKQKTLNISLGLAALL
jgi:hypothetical protein